MKVLFFVLCCTFLHGQTTVYNFGLNTTGNPCLIISKQTGETKKVTPVCFETFDESRAAAVMIRQLLEYRAADIEKQRLENESNLIQINRVLFEIQNRMNAEKSEGKKTGG